MTDNKNDNITTETLANGLVCVHIRRPGPVGYCGLAVRAGSRDEDLRAGEAGLAHYVEHCIFKGTQNRTADDIRNCMEQVGGELNAFTGKDQTVIYTVFPSGNLRRAMSLVADLTTTSTFPADELDKEREVVESEIDSYLDSPADQIFDDFEDIVFRGTPLGHNILGTHKSLEGLGPQQCLSWLNRFYTAANCVLFYSGSTPAATFMRMAAKYFGIMRAGERAAIAPSPLDERSVTRTRRRDTHQTHIIMGCAMPEMSLDDRFALQLLNNILGGPGMNARLNVELREKRGLVYTIESSVAFPAGATLFTVYMGCDPKDAAVCRRLVRETIGEFADKAMTDKEIAAARRQYLGQMVIAGDNKENAAIAIARAIQLHGHALTRRETVSLLDRVTPDAVRAMARRLTDLSTLTFSPGN